MDDGRKILIASIVLEGNSILNFKEILGLRPLTVLKCRDTLLASVNFHIGQVLCFGDRPGNCPGFARDQDHSLGESDIHAHKHILVCWALRSSLSLGVLRLLPTLRRFP